MENCMIEEPEPYRDWRDEEEDDFDPDWYLDWFDEDRRPVFDLSTYWDEEEAPSE